MGIHVQHVQSTAIDSYGDEACWPLIICLLGDFRLLHHGELVPVRVGGKCELLLSYLALENGQPLSRAVLLKGLWPDSDPGLASHSLSNLIYTVQKLLAPALPSGLPLLYLDGHLRLNLELGIGVDVRWFDELVRQGALHIARGNTPAAVASYSSAVALYRGDLYVAIDARTMAERERLRARCLTLLAWLAEYYLCAGDADLSLEYLWRLLAIDPCHEEAHRMVMRCYMRRGERGAALRQYHLCVAQLNSKFGATPESATVGLFEQIRDHPATPDTNVT